jgi:hypothetical protein
VPMESLWLVIIWWSWNLPSCQQTERVFFPKAPEMHVTTKTYSFNKVRNAISELQINSSTALL